MKKNNSMCLTSFIMGCVSIFIPLMIVPFLTTIFGIIGICNFDSETEKNKWFGVVGLILGILYLLSWVYNYVEYY